MATNHQTDDVTYHATIDSPIGPLRLQGRRGALVGLHVEGHEHAPPLAEDVRPARGELDGARRELDEYFAGQRTEFTLAVDPAGTPFQQAVWAALLEIPFGVTWSYGELAARIGKPSASRAVGAANGQNPVSIVIPCHRVIGSTGTLTGYGWGVARKAWLLDHEGATLASVGAASAASSGR